MIYHWHYSFFFPAVVSSSFFFHVKCVASGIGVPFINCLAPVFFSFFLPLLLFSVCTCSSSLSSEVNAASIILLEASLLICTEDLPAALCPVIAFCILSKCFFTKSYHLLVSSLLFPALLRVSLCVCPPISKTLIPLLIQLP